MGIAVFGRLKKNMVSKVSIARFFEEL